MFSMILYILLYGMIILISWSLYRIHKKNKQMQEELRISLENLKRSNQDLEQFAYIASHDLQEPLRLVTSFTQLLSKRYHNQLDEKANEYIKFTVDGAKRMQEIIEDLLAYSRLGHETGNFVVTNTNESLKQAIENLKISIAETGAIITHDELPEIFADDRQIKSLFQNLIGNAIKFRKTTPIIHVSVKRTKYEWEFCVKDNGIGIAPEYADKIFIMFQRLHPGSEYSGTGIGLAICKKIITRHGGRIWVESKLGQGSRFYFTFPVQEIKNERPTAEIGEYTLG